MQVNQQIVFIDSQVSDYQTLVSGLKPGIEVVILKSDRPGIEQITSILSQKPYSTVHVVSHGSPGCLYLGNTNLSLDTLNKYQQELKTWFSPIPQSSNPLISQSPQTFHETSLLIYGCNVAAGDAGEEFITKLHKITGAEIAASTTLIGNADKGGNWELDFQTNDLSSTELIFDRATQNSYSGVFGTISGNAFLDFNNDGKKRATNDGDFAAEDVGVAGITVTAYDANGNIIGSSVATDNNGNYSINNSGDVAARVEFTNVPESYESTSLVNRDATTVSNVFFVEAGAGDVTANLGIYNPNNFLDEDLDPRLITTCYVLGGFSENSNDAAIVSVPHSTDPTDPNVFVAGDADNVDKTVEATIGQVGSTYGLAFNKETNDLFAGAFQKRFSDVGTGANGNDNGNGVIYRITNARDDDASNNTVDKFIDLGAFLGNNDLAGAYSHGDSTANDSASNRDGINWLGDKDSFDQVGKVALGDVEISEDGEHLWTINLADRKLYKIEIGDGSEYTYGGTETRSIVSYDILAGIDNSQLGLNPSLNIRPFAIAEQNGVIYVGMVNSAQYDGNGVAWTPDTGTGGMSSAADLHAYVYTFDPATGTFGSAPVINFNLDYERQRKSLNFSSISQKANWTPWVADFDELTPQLGTSSNLWIDETQPILSDIEFDNNGDMILGFRDRTGDQIGSGSNDLDGNRIEFNGNTYTNAVASGGDLLRAGLTGDNQWTINSGDVDNLANTEYYGGDNYTGGSHNEIAQGGLIQIPGYTSVESIALDPAGNFGTGGIAGFDNDGSDGRTRSYDTAANNGNSNNATAARNGGGIELFRGGLGKANGLGDLEAVTNLAPITIGDRIWNDVNANGIQDAGEAGIGSVTLSLYDAGGNLVGTATTDSNGNYYFHTDSNITDGYVSAGLDPNTNYEIRVDSTNFDSGNALNGFNLSLANLGSNDATDSDAVDNNGVPTIFLTTGDFGSNDTSYDTGFSNIAYDFGDAPDTSTSVGTGDYQTIADNDGARHIIDPTIALGSNIDGDDGTQQNALANADDDDNSTNDEDGVTFTTSTINNISGASFSANVVVNAPSSRNINTTVAEDNFNDNAAGGFAGGAGWSGDWIEGGESDGAAAGGVQEDGTVLEVHNNNKTVSRDVVIPGGATNVTLSFDYTVAGDLTGDGNNTDDPLDIEINDGNGFVSLTTQGDITINESSASGSVNVDVSNYVNTSGGTTTIRFDTNNLGGVTNSDGYDIDNVEITADVPTPVNTTLIGWIDFDRDGIFQSDEAQILRTSDTNPLLINGSTNTLTWNNVDSLITNGGGTTYARFRVSTDGNLNANFSTGLLNDGEVEDYRLTVSGTDYGDAPDSYLTTISSGNPASHTIVDGLSIGSTVDDDDGTQQNADATADDTPADKDDEDGIASFATLETDDDSYSVTLDVTNTTGGDATLIGWIDFDGSGTFESDEAVSVDVNNGDTSATLTWSNTDTDTNNNLPNDIVAGSTFARFRLSTDGAATFNTNTSGGAATNGEVEDYQLDITQVYDYGDAPDSTTGNTAGDYQTTTANNNTSTPRHAIIKGLSLGTNIDADDGTLQNTAADADDAKGDGLLNYEYYDLTTVDDGTLDSVGDIPDNGATEIGTVDLDSDLLTQANQGDTDDFGLRYTGYIYIETAGTYTFYKSSDRGSTLAIDNTVVVDNDTNQSNTEKSGTYDFTAPGWYPLEIEYFETTGTQSLAIEYEGGGITRTSLAGAIASTIPSDEDGVTFTASTGTAINPNDGSYSVEVNVNNVDNKDVSLIGWIDFDRNGTFDPNEAVVKSLSTSSPNETLTWTFPNDIEEGVTYARFRLSSDPNLTINNPLNTLSDGEIEDYKLNIGIDYGDAPDDGLTGNDAGDYNTTKATGGAAHAIDTNLTIGTVIDGDTGSQEDSLATADDTDGTDDEDGVDSFATLDISDTSYSVEVDVNNATGEEATLIGWIDFDQSGTFDSDEAVIVPVADGATSVDLTWNNGGNPLPGIKSGSTYARFRLSSDFNGIDTQSDLTTQSNIDILKALASDGEVEDYRIFVEGGKDFGDAPDTYKTLDSSGVGASHNIVSGLTIGGTVDSETDATPNVSATGDDIIDADDEDGVNFTQGKIIRTDANSYSVDVVVNNTQIITTTLAEDNFSTNTYNNNSGQWSTDWQEGEKNRENITTPANITQGNVYVSGQQLNITNDRRFARRAINLSGTTGTINLSFDYKAIGAKPDKNEPLDVEISNDGGTTFTEVADFARDTTVNDFTSSGSINISDDILSGGSRSSNVVVRFRTASITGLSEGEGFAIDNVQITESITPDATLIGWVDFDRDGTFEAGEADTATVTAGTTTNTLTWNGLDFSGVTPGETYARFRLSTDDTNFDATTPGGLADDGEVEDYLLGIKNPVDGTGASEVINDSSDNFTTTEADLIIGGAGQDTLTGGAGDNCFHFNRTSDGIDTITDFNTNGTDKLDFSDMFAPGGELEGVSNPFGTHVIAEKVTNGSNTEIGTLVKIDFDPGDSLNDKNVVYLQDYTTTMTADDFIF